MRRVAVAEYAVVELWHEVGAVSPRGLDLLSRRSTFVDVVEVAPGACVRPGQRVAPARGEVRVEVPGDAARPTGAPG